MNPPSRTITVRRIETSDHGTFGLLSIEDFACFTLEPPWHNNESQISCIPEGSYVIVPWSSQRWPNTWHILNVPTRTAILMHTGNVAGDKSKGYKRHSIGCMLVGKWRGWIEQQKAIFSSRPMLAEINRRLGRRAAVNLIIEGGGRYVVS